MNSNLTKSPNSKKQSKNGQSDVQSYKIRIIAINNVYNNCPFYKPTSTITQYKFSDYLKL